MGPQIPETLAARYGPVGGIRIMARHSGRNWHIPDPHGVAECPHVPQIVPQLVYKVKGFAQTLSAFTVILTQSATDATYYTQLGGRSVVPVGNIKFASPPLPYAPTDLQALTSAIADRPVWLYASTHAGEEELAAAVLRPLKTKSRIC